MKMKALTGVLLTLALNVARASDLSADAWCDYDAQKAEAEKLLNQAPTLVVGFGRNNTALNNVMIVGINESLSKFLQGNLSHKIGDADCRLYRVTAEIQKHVMYDSQNLQLQQLRERLSLTEEGIRRVDELTADERAHLGVGTSSLQNVALLDSTKETLTIAKSQLEQQIALIVIPEADGEERLSSLLKLAGVYTAEEQHLIARQSSLQSWDLNITVGNGTNPGYPLLHVLPNEGFATATFTYSFGGPKRLTALNRAADAYTTSVLNNPTGPITLANILRTQVTRARDAASTSLGAYHSYDSSLTDQLATVKEIDTAVARAFRIQLNIARINNDIELGTNQATREFMTAYLAKNFTEE